jgi:hypothetical protein
MATATPQQPDTAAASLVDSDSLYEVIYESPTHSRGFQGNDIVEDDSILPGFRLPLETLFANRAKSDLD